MQSTRAMIYLWVSPNTAIGLLGVLLAILTGGRSRRVAGVIEAHGGALAWLLRHASPLPGGIAAITFGHTVLALNQPTLDRTRHHERIHVRQYERWGPVYIPAYLLASLAAWWRGEHFYRDNRFEREAYEQS